MDINRAHRENLCCFCRRDYIPGHMCSAKREAQAAYEAKRGAAGQGAPKRNRRTEAVNFSDEDRGTPMLPHIESEESGALLARMMDTLDIMNKRMGALEERKD